MVLRRVWPTAAVVTDTDVLSATLDASDYLVGSPMAGDGGSIFFSVEPPTEGSYDVDLFNPSVSFVRITCMTEFTLGNSFLQVVCDPCVASRADDRERASDGQQPHDDLQRACLARPG